ncbi:MAG: HAD-IIA family hydrolase [Chloroflexota bacterium]|nr:HAD-IIA family hydrolase [Chloroflexota bacterium]
MSKPQGPLRLLVDLDGVLYRGATALPGVAEFFAWTEAAGHAFLLVTNNSLRTQAEVAGNLRRMGLTVEPDRILTSAVATRAWLDVQAPEGARVQALGGSGLIQALFSPGSQLTPDWESPEWLVLGQDFDITYQKLTAACIAVQNGARFVVTNPDTTLPTEAGLSPGAGAWQAIVTLVTGVQATVIGKPEPGIFETALAMMPPEGEVIVIGDRLDTDILAGNRLGATTALVLTGVSTRSDVDTFSVKPDYIFDDLPALVHSWS